MGWRDLLAHPGETLDLPWVGGPYLDGASQHWTINGAGPREHGWYTWLIQGRRVQLTGPAEPAPEQP